MIAAKCNRSFARAWTCALFLAAILCGGRTRADDKSQRLAAQFDGGRRYAIVAGVNGYTDPAAPKLRFCVADANLISRVLVEKCGYAKENVVLMTDDQPPELRPTKPNLQKQIAKLFKRASAADTVLVHLSGHGAEIGGQSVFLPIDFDAENPIGSTFRIDELRDMLRFCAAGQKLLLLDCCHSGGVKSGISLGFNGEDSKEGKGVGGLITLASCRKSETSLESPEQGQGIYTYCVARGLGGEADFNHDGIVDSDELYRFVVDEVAALAAAKRGKQTPVRIIGEDVSGLFALARVSGEPVVKPPPPTPPAVSLKVGDTVANSIGMKLTIVPGGIFKMGSPETEGGRNKDEEQGRVGISHAFLIGTYEVTQAEYEKVMGKNPSYFSKEGDGAAKIEEVKDADRLPVENVTWADAKKFCDKLSKLPAEKATGFVYRLPTEAEWEWACRGKTTTTFNTGELINSKQANLDGSKPYQEAPEGPNLKRTAPVGSYEPNAFGLYDMHGNVAEWTYDFYSEAPLRHESVDPTGPRDGTDHVTRGGAFSGDVTFARCAARRPRSADYQGKTVGFRVVAVLAGNNQE